MKTTSILLASALMLAAFGVTGSHAQSTALIHHKIVKAQNSPPSAGRDFWFAAPSNEWGIEQIGTYIKVYITSSNNCTAYVSSQYLGGVAGYSAKVAVTAYETSTFTVPSFWEMESSGIPENKAIHVYSTTADLSVYFMSNQYQSGDGSYIIPTIGWGKDYVVAAYGSLFASDGLGTYDLPSECAIVANQDNTTFEITPSCDCRQCTDGNFYGDANSGIVVYPNGEPQTFQLNRGQCMQFMPIQASDDSNYDMTGTIIHANQPVGVIGASSDPEIPAGFPRPNFVCEMMPPVRTWGETYYASNPIQPPGETDKDKARYLFISSVSGQTINRAKMLLPASMKNVLSPINLEFIGMSWNLERSFIAIIHSSSVWYLNSATYPDHRDGLGDPAESIIAPKEQYTKSVIFQTPLSVKNIVPYDDYANIIINVHEANRILFDHKNINGYGAQSIDGEWEVVNIPHIAPGVHTVTNSDSGVGVHVYGYGFNESYAWGTQSSTGTFNSPDTIAPLVDTQGACLNAFIHVSDSGLLPSGQKQSGLGEIRLDTQVNMNFQVDNDWIEGSGADSSGYTMNVIDPTRPAILVIEVYDLAGNVSTITSVYEPEIDSIKPPLQNLGITLAGSNVPNIKFDTIYNTGNRYSFDFSALQMLYGNRGFTLFDSTGGPLDKSPLQPEHRRLIMIKFLAIEPTLVVDSIIFGNACFYEDHNVAVIGGGGGNDFLVTSQTWINEIAPPPPGGYVKTVSIENLSV